MNKHQPTLTGQYRVAKPQVVSEIVDGEAIIVHMDKGYYYSLNESGARIWELLLLGLSTADLLEHFVSELQGNTEDMVEATQAFIQLLFEEELITATTLPDIPPPRPTSIKQPPSVPAPTLERYTDMKDFLLVDPIHEVDESGWPHKKQS